MKYVVVDRVFCNNWAAQGCVWSQFTGYYIIGEPLQKSTGFSRFGNCCEFTQLGSGWSLAAIRSLTGF